MWNPEAETLPRERLRALQLERLRQTVQRQLDHVPPMRDRLHAAGITSPSDIGSLDDLPALPFSHKTDLREHYPFGLFAVPHDHIVRIHASSGTRGKPTVVGYTRDDLGVWSEVMARSLVSAGVRPGMVVPISGGLGQRQVLMLEDLGGQVLCSTPSYALNIAQTLSEQGVGLDRLKLAIGVFGAEPWTEQLRDALETQLGIQALNAYGLSEIVGPGVAAECHEARNGAHVQEDQFLVEVIDPHTANTLAPGETGELVFTTLTKQALPMVRYRTGDISSLDVTPCVCGRTSVRMDRVRGRYDDMLIIRGVNLYPSEVERVLLAMPDVAPHYQLVVERPGAMDELTVLCEPTASVDTEGLRQRIHYALREATGLSMVIQLQAPNTVPRSEGKAVRVIDKRA